VQGFESAVNKVFQKEKLVNSKTINLQTSLKSAGANLVQCPTFLKTTLLYLSLPIVNFNLSLIFAGKVRSLGLGRALLMINGAY